MRIEFILLLLIFACSKERLSDSPAVHMAYDKINYYTYPTNARAKPFKYRLTYYFNNSLPHRWMELDSLGYVVTEYIYSYNDAWNHSGAKYREDRNTQYNVERVRFANDSTQITEWLDSAGNVYYTMTDFLNRDGKTQGAEFKGDEVHGYDSTFYTSQSFVERVFFTNTRGKKMNDRAFMYDSINDQNDWLVRRKVMDDTLREIQVREVYYDNTFTSATGIYYEGVLSTAELSENTFSFTQNGNSLFLSRTSDWDHQRGFLVNKLNGLFSEVLELRNLDSLYNGAISPGGDKIIFCTKVNGSLQAMLTSRSGNMWSTPINLTELSGIEGGYFYWLSDSELYFSQTTNSGDIVAGRLDNNQLSVVDSLATCNTLSGNEFSPFVDPGKRYLIFTRYVEGDTSQQGFFVSRNQGTFANPQWSTPEKITQLPYGWNAWVLSETSQFLFTDGNDIMSVPLDTLDLD